MATTDTSTEALTEHRVAMIEELGFSKDEAQLLSETYYTVRVKGEKGKEDRHYPMRVDHHYIRKMLEGGATREQVIQILT